MLISSLARSDYLFFSGADFVIIVKRTLTNHLERLRDFIRPSPSTDVEPYAYTFKEFLEMASSSSRIVSEVLAYGKLLARTLAL